jgi:hypothetical protein
MFNLTVGQEKALDEINHRMSTQDLIEDLMLMHSAYVEEITNTEKYSLDRDTILDIQSKLFTVQTVLEMAAIIDAAMTPLRKVL